MLFLLLLLQRLVLRSTDVGNKNKALSVHLLNHLLVEGWRQNTTLLVT